MTTESHSYEWRRAATFDRSPNRMAGYFRRELPGACSLRGPRRHLGRHTGTMTNPSAANVRIRRATRDDARAIADLYDQLHHAHWDERSHGSHIDWLEEVESAVADENTTVLVADADGVVAGTVRLEFATRAYGRIAEVRRLYVPEAWRRRGIATRLMAAVEDLAATGDAIEVRLTLLTRNRAAQEFYQGREYRQFAARLHKTLE
jgi:GNAT superfamily N-acetyltransferase